jgi:hypothetical protein
MTKYYAHTSGAIIETADDLAYYDTLEDSMKNADDGDEILELTVTNRFVVFTTRKAVQVAEFKTKSTKKAGK